MRVAMAQISSTDDPAANLELVRDNVADAAARGAEVVIFPEATMCRFGVRLDRVAEPLDGPWARAVGDIAAEHRVTVIAGMFTPADVYEGRQRVRNTLVIAKPDGTLAGYDKIHLYDAFGFTESSTVQAGSQPVTVDVGGQILGVATCYDIRFPELFVALADRGAQVIAVPASWGAGAGKLHQWLLLATARALDSGTFVVAVGQAEPDDPAVAESSAPTGIGHSMVASPFGETVVEYAEGPHLDVHDLDLDVVSDARERIAVGHNRRLGR